MDRKPSTAWTETAPEPTERRMEDRLAPAWNADSDSAAGHFASPVYCMSTAHDIGLFYLEGEIGLPEFHYLQHLMASLSSKGFTKFVLSFEQVEHLNYRVFHELMRLAKSLRDVSGDMRFTGINSYLYHIFLFAGADQTIDHFHNIEEAILSFHNSHGRHWH